MMRKLHKLLRELLQQKKLATVVTCCIAIIFTIVLFSYSTGPALNGQAVTGAPFNNSLTCATCHSGGNFGATIKVQLLDSTNASVKTYSPGKHYTFKITLKKTSTASAGYGFQTTCAKASANTNINSWGKLPANTHNTLLSGHNYVEHSAVLTKGVIKIPWTAPAKGTGSVTFYTAGNVVNMDKGITGDQPVNKSLTITEGVAPMPVLFTSYSANMQGNSTLVAWSTTKESNVKNFIVEKSLNGNDFSSIATIPAKGWGNYSFTDNNISPKAYYRLRVEDMQGNSVYSDVLSVAKPDKNNYTLSLYNHAGYAYIMFSNGSKQQRAQVLYTDMQGRPLVSGITTVNEGDNIWQIPADKVKGIAIITVITEDGIKTTMKFSAN